MNVVILCGGYGTRLAGVWDGPKCLAPLGDGRPILYHLIRRVRQQLSRSTDITLITGHKGDKVAVALRELSLLSPHLVLKQETQPSGTAQALRFTGVQPTVLVLNGDTLPLYALSDLMRAWALCRPEVLIAYSGGKPAGAVILGPEAVHRLHRSTENNFEAWLDESKLSDVLRVGVNGFLDIGTPHNFELAKIWTEGL